jgi:ATP-binding cassette subfamily B protein
MVEEEVQQRGYDPHLMRRLIAYSFPYWRAVIAAIVCLLLNSSLQVLGPLLTKTAIDRYLAPTGERYAPWVESRLPADALSGLAFIALLYLSTIVLSFVFDFSQQYLMQWTGQRAMFDLRRNLLGKLQTLDLNYYDTNPVGRMVTRVTTDVDALNELFSAGLVTIFGDLLVLVFIVVTMFRLSPPLTLLLLLVIPVSIAVVVVFRRSVTSANRQIRVAVARINSYLQEHIAGMSVVQLFNREEKCMDEFREVNRRHVEAYRGAINAYGWFYPAVEFISTLAFAGLLARGGWQVRENELSLGVLVAFFQYAVRIFRPIQDLSEKYNILQSAMAAAERIFQLLDTPVKVTSPPSPREFPAAGQNGEQAVEFDGVSFRYKDDSDWVLRDVSFRIEPGETIAVVGHTGAGKTTLISLLLRFYDVQQGAIRVGGADVRDLDPRELRRHFGVVLQDPHLFTGTIGGNIRLGTARITAEDLELAADQVNLSEFIKSLPEGFGYSVRERGAGLSTGQKQLISFARALAHNPQFLILDEATSSVDTETEIKVREALDRMVEGRTSLIIAHRLSTIQRADRIFVMHKGQLRETGSHQELLAQRGIYWRLYQLQYRDQELAKP